MFTLFKDMSLRARRARSTFTNIFNVTVYFYTSNYTYLDTILYKYLPIAFIELFHILLL